MNGMRSLIGQDSNIDRITSGELALHLSTIQELYPPLLPLLIELINDERIIISDDSYDKLKETRDNLLEDPIDLDRKICNHKCHHGKCAYGFSWKNGDDKFYNYSLKDGENFVWPYLFKPSGIKMRKNLIGHEVCSIRNSGKYDNGKYENLSDDVIDMHSRFKKSFIFLFDHYSLIRMDNELRRVDALAKI